MKNESKEKLHIIAITAFAVLIVLGLACASAPQVTVELNQKYLGMTQSPAPGERIIQKGISVNGSSSACRDTQHSVSVQRMGSSYQIRESDAPSKHRHEPILDQLSAIAKNNFPNSLVNNVNIRNASIGGNRHVNPRQEEYKDTERRTNSSGQYVYVEVTKVRTVWDCYLFYTADVVTNEPMPETVTYSVDLDLAGVTRADMYRRADNYFDDRRFNEANSLGIRITRTDFDVGRIRGEYYFSIPTMGSYRIVSAFTIDVHDSRAELRFTDTFMQRSIGSSSEPIFLQSVATAASAELLNFSNSLRSYISTRR